MKKKLIRLLVIIIPLLALDQVTKYFAKKILAERTIPVINGVLEFRYLENRGAVWGSLQNQLVLLIAVTIILSAVLLVFYFKIPEGKKNLPLVYTVPIILAGAIGNFIDRIVYNYVIDFIYFKIINFPIFNVADIYVTCSTILLAILIIFYYKDEDFQWMQFKKAKTGDE